jgi:DNA-binding beta-propeller fold protein YncE
VTQPEEGRVSRIDAGTGEVLDTIEVGGFPQEILYAEGAVWVVDSPGDTVLRIDPITLRVMRLDAGPWPYRLTAAPGLIFVTNVVEEGTVTVLRSTDGARVATLPVGPNPTATAVVPGPAPDRARASSEGLFWYLWVGRFCSSSSGSLPRSRCATPPAAR